MRSRQSLEARQLRLPPTARDSPPAKSTRSPIVSEASSRPLMTPFQPQPNILPDNHMNPPSDEPEEPDNPQAQAAAGAAGEDDTSVANGDAPGDRFDEVGLGEPAYQSPAFKKPTGPPQQPKKPSIFSRFGGSSAHESQQVPASEKPGNSGLGLGLGMFGRKRGASGQGAELGSIQQPRQTIEHGHVKHNSISSTKTMEVRTGE